VQERDCDRRDAVCALHANGGLEARIGPGNACLLSAKKFPFQRMPEGAKKFSHMRP
jgi:hypothetical protein